MLVQLGPNPDNITGLCKTEQNIPLAKMVMGGIISHLRYDIEPQRPTSVQWSVHDVIISVHADCQVSTNIFN